MAAIRRKQITLSPSGNAGVATATSQWTLGRPGVLRFIAIDYGSGVPATADLIVKRDNTSGAAVYTVSNNSTDIGPVALGTAGMDEANNASAATDGLSGGIPFSTGLFIDVAQADPYANSTDQIVVDLYYEPMRQKDITMTTSNAGAGTSAAAVQWTTNRPGVVRFIAVNYSASEAATADFTIKRDTTAGAVIFTNGNSATDLAPTAVGTGGKDEGNNALAASDAVSGGLVFNHGLYLALAQTNALKTNVVSIWYDA